MAGQAIRYIANEPLDGDTLEVFWDLFTRHRDAFSESYVRNVTSKAEWARFKAKQAEAVAVGCSDGTDIDVIFAAFEASKQGMSSVDYA